MNGRLNYKKSSKTNPWMLTVLRDPNIQETPIPSRLIHPKRTFTKMENSQKSWEFGLTSSLSAILSPLIKEILKKSWRIKSSSLNFLVLMTNPKRLLTSETLSALKKLLLSTALQLNTCLLWSETSVIPSPKWFTPKFWSPWICLINTWLTISERMRHSKRFKKAILLLKREKT